MLIHVNIFLISNKSSDGLFIEIIKTFARQSIKINLVINGEEVVWENVNLITICRTTGTKVAICFYSFLLFQK